MIEALVAVTITTIAGAALLTSLGGAIQASTSTAHATVAAGLAAQLMDEIASVRFPDAVNTVPLGATRGSFDDVDDFDGWSSRPPHTKSGVPLGTEGSRQGIDSPRLDQLRPDQSFLDRFTRIVEVERLQPDNSTGWIVTTQHTKFRRVTVRVTYTDAQANVATLAESTRIFSGVSVTP